jgi:hypothetical protein
MTDSEKVERGIEALKAAEREPAQVALPILNGLVGLVQGDPDSLWKSKRRVPARSWPSAKSEKPCSRPARRSPVGVSDQRNGTVDVACEMTLANAIHNALGKRFYSLPMSPPRVLTALEATE